MDYYTVTEFAQLTQSSPRTVQRWCRKGIIKAYKVGHKYLIPHNWAEFKEREGEKRNE